MVKPSQPLLTALLRCLLIYMASAAAVAVELRVAVAANFQRMVRIADSTGIPVDGLVDALSGSIPDELELRRFHSAGNTPPRGRFHALKSWLVRNIALRMLLRGGRDASRNPESH